MDYCSTCRRHLNGALVCPGCGAYAPDIAPDIAPGFVDGHAVPGPATPTPPEGTAAGTVANAAPAWEAAASQASYGTGAAPHTEPSGGPEDTAATVGAPGAAPAPQGRAARRRQMARWKKNQRRAVVATAVALVGGGLTVASLDRPTGDRAQAATVPDTKGMGSAEEPAEQYTRPTPTRPARTATPSRPDRTRTGDTAQRESVPVGTPTPTTPANTRTDAVTSPQRPVTEPQQPRTTPPVSDGTTSGGTTSGSGGSADGGDAASQPTSPPPAADDGTAQEPSQPSTAPATTTQPDKLCLLVVCLG
ncbi:SCO2400 family protein [Streptomyces bullii]|uniref:Uncharacterized protein n=1 Tax=Streptomyces bullii TaxID=349910 RepID=A0ABW0UM33_9ACTN